MAKQYNCDGPKPVPGIPKPKATVQLAEKPTQPTVHIDKGHINVRNPGKHAEKLRHS